MWYKKNAGRFCGEIDTDIPVPTRDIVLVRSRLVPQSEGAARFTNLLVNREDKRDKIL